MNTLSLLQFIGETLANMGVKPEEPLTAHQLRVIDRAWREKYLDTVREAPCAHEQGERIGGQYCADCGRNVLAIALGK